MSDHLREECGVFGVYGDPEASNHVYLGLYALQHRGQEACGIATFDGRKFSTHKSMGLVVDGIEKSDLERLPGTQAIGHVRYSTHGGKDDVENIQPFRFRTSIGELAICHNGNLTNAGVLKTDLERRGAIFQTSSDTEVFMHLIAHAGSERYVDRIAKAMQLVHGAYSMLAMSSDTLFAIRDPFGFRPLVLGQKGSAYLVASETCALDLVDADFVRDIEPGEVLEIGPDGLRSHRPMMEPKRMSFCSFEPIYFSRPDSLLFGKDIYGLRKRMGTELAKESPADADVVIAIPDSGVPMAAGYSQEAGIELDLGLIRNHYVGRTFIEPAQSIRDFGVKLKLNPVRSVLKDKRVVVVDDSIVRGTTSVKIVRMLKHAGAREVHLRVGCPPITHSCYFGVDTPSRENLIAAQKTVEEIRQFLSADSLAFLSTDGLKRALGEEGRSSYCYGCFSGNYPEEIGTAITQQPTDKSGPGLRASRVKSKSV